MSVNNPDCPTGCSSYIQEADFDWCNPYTTFGEIDHIYVMSNAGSNLNNWNDLDEWQTRMALDPSSDYDAIQDLYVVADLPAAEQEEVEISGGRKVYPPASFTINWDIDDLSDANYEFMRWLECNFFVKIWFSAGDYLYGGNVGIETSLSGKLVIERGQKSLQKISGTAFWESQFSPERTTNPMA